MALPTVPSHWTAQTSKLEVAEFLLRLSEATVPELAVYPNIIAFSDNRQKQRYLDSISPNEADKNKSYHACATISGAVRSITAQSIALIESSPTNASKNNTEETHRHVVGMARAGQQYYIYSSIFDPAKHEGEPPRIRTQHGCSNLINLLDLIRSPKTTTVSAVKNTRGKAVKGCGKTIAKIWMTGSASTDLSPLTEAAAFLHNVASSQAGVSPVQPELTNAAGYQWVQLAW